MKDYPYNRSKPPINLGRGRSLGRRALLKGLAAGAAGWASLPLLTRLPFLEGLAEGRGHAAEPSPRSFAIFLRQANGIARAQNTGELGEEPERFWPRAPGALTSENVAGRALDELSAHLDDVLVLGGVNMMGPNFSGERGDCFDFGDGHAQGAFQVLTAHRPMICGAGGNSEAGGESLDFRIARELNPGGRDSLALYAGPGGWLGGPCISHRGAGRRLSALNRPASALATVYGVHQQQSLSDLLQEQFDSLRKNPRLSANDLQRLELHQTALADLEVSLACRDREDLEMQLAGLGSIHDSNDGEEVWSTVRAHIDVAVHAIACGFTRSVSLQVGSGNDGETRYYAPDGSRMPHNYHYYSHRRASHDDQGEIIANADQMHHEIDRQFARAFSYLLNKLNEYDLDGDRMLDHGVAVWLNDLGNGPVHSPYYCPWIVAGNCGGYFRQGEYLELSPYDPYAGSPPMTHARLLNSIATAVGCRSPGEDLCNDFGDPILDRSPLEAIRAS